MEKATLKSVIIGLKMSGLTFAEISNRLRTDYDIDMSRQAVHGMYNRAISKSSVDNSVAVAVMTTDVCRYHSLGLNVNEIKDIVNEGEYNLTIRQINMIIQNNQEVIKEMLEKYIEYAMENIDNFEEIIMFNGIKASDKVIYNIKEQATERLLVKACKECLSNLLNKGIDKEIIRNTARKFNIANNISEII